MANRPPAAPTPTIRTYFIWPTGQTVRVVIEPFVGEDFATSGFIGSSRF
jgi:hypothetical protein